MAAKPLDPHHCSIIATLDALGDTWSILVLRELFYGVRRFNEIQTELGISRSVLTDRLNRLLELGAARAGPSPERARVGRRPEDGVSEPHEIVPELRPDVVAARSCPAPAGVAGS